MNDSIKEYKITCCHCKQPFHVRYPEVDPGAEGTGDITITCLYCSKDVIAKLPRKHIEKGSILRELPSRPA